MMFIMYLESTKNLHSGCKIRECITMILNIEEVFVYNYISNKLEQTSKIFLS